MSIKSLLVGLAGAMMLAAMPVQAVEITHDLGTTEVSDALQRIVVLEYSFVDTLAAVGVSPVGIADDDTRESIIPAYTAIIGDEWTSVGLRREPSLELIASLQPDLIIADTSRHEAIYGALSEIAPTIVFDSLTGTYEVAIEAAKTIAHAVGKDAEMAARLAEHTATMDAFKAEVGDVSDLSIQFMIDNGEGIFLHSRVSYNGSLLPGSASRAICRRQMAIPIPRPSFRPRWNSFRRSTRASFCAASTRILVSPTPGLASPSMTISTRSRTGMSTT
jgi:ABC-type Fe3+-citrate transport system substrate-binding protein